MNIYELEKQATPGLVEYVEPAQFKVGLVGQNGFEVCHAQACNQSRVDMVHLMHCRNNFMKALKEIHRLRDMLVEQRKDGGWSIDDLDYDDRLITELEEVK